MSYYHKLGTVIGAKDELKSSPAQFHWILSGTRKITAYINSLATTNSELKSTISLATKSAVLVC